MTTIPQYHSDSQPPASTDIPGLNTLFILILALFLLGFGRSAQASSSPTITLVIDDIGYNLRNGLRAVNLPGAISYAVLPHTPYSQRLAKAAHKKGKTVMLHAPMTNVHQWEPGPGTLSPSMDRKTFDQALKKALADIPFAQGVNNHMGSELTQDSVRMQWLMEEISKRRLFFIDSRTTAKSVAAKTAKANGIPNMSRDVFLDHIRTPSAVNEAFDTLVRQAQRNGHATGIGHPHKVTLDMLESRIPELQAQGIRLVSVPDQLLAMGQTYERAQPAFITPEVTTPNRSPAFWRSEIQQLTRFKETDVTHPKIIRKEVVVRKKSPNLQPINRTEKRAEPSRENTPPLRDAGRDMLQQPVHHPDWLTPKDKQNWATTRD
ncbi:divergent polysaccharide deacetylase family protein [Oceanospirillum linum]|uniref:Divergent polysaccharide deacetylase family protein n=1 Tax=Oceanospirillum linum TaxID=966 RepID=A0A1T1HBJ8_OCELI|nr:divergent polysaccharide deacetylase family protein [Oceanospirillum linum]OOV87234.1 hypothetical protein BTA35_0209610 [Oceanospirillum linum]SEF78603.1 Uncharacterized conserved protein YibQ, putative polysaccharide deacetylase 2 family [Oleiphilus messinensis]SMP18133.1 Uncharacterized conserved protein YibQ, putative polysaccharide deacetylase 2 family [Oceanospirillum linum]